MGMTYDLLGRDFLSNESYAGILAIGEHALVLVVAQDQDVSDDALLLDVECVVALVAGLTSLPAVVEPNYDLLVSRSVGHFYLPNKIRLKRGFGVLGFWGFGVQGP